MSAPTADNALDRAVKGIPLPVRVGVLVLWLAIGFYAKGNEHEAGWIDVVLALGLALYAAPRLAACGPGSADAGPRALCDGPALGLFFFITGCLLVFGPWTLLDGDPETAPYVGVPMFLVGLVLAVLFVRYIRKPVRPGTREVAIAAWTRSPYDDSWRVGADWYPPARPPGPPDEGRDSPQNAEEMK